MMSIFKTMHMSCFSSKFLPRFNTDGCLLLEPIFIWWLQNNNIPAPYLLVSTQHSSLSKSPPFSISYLLSIQNHGLFYFSMIYNSLLYMHILVLKWSQIWPVGLSSALFQCSCDMLPLCYSKYYLIIILIFVGL